MRDLFEHLDEVSPYVRKIIEGFETSEGYADLEVMLKRMNECGYTFDYGLDGEPHSLRRMEIGLSKFPDSSTGTVYSTKQSEGDVAVNGEGEYVVYTGGKWEKIAPSIATSAEVDSGLVGGAGRPIKIPNDSLELLRLSVKKDETVALVYVMLSKIRLEKVSAVQKEVIERLTDVNVFSAYFTSTYTGVDLESTVLTRLGICVDEMSRTNLISDNLSSEELMDMVKLIID